MRALPFLFTLALAARAPAQEAREAVLRGFVVALENGTPRGFEPVADDGAVDGRSWESLRDVLERYRRISVLSARTASVPGDPGALRLTLDASGVLANAWGVRRKLPSRWILRFGGDASAPLLSGAATAEHDAARELIDARTDAARRGVLERHDDLDQDSILAEARKVVISLARLGRYSAEFSMAREALVFDLSFALDRGDRVHASRTLAAFARLEIANHERVALPYGRAAVELADGADCQTSAEARFAYMNARARLPEMRASGLRGLLSVAEERDGLEDPRVSLQALHNVAQIQKQVGNLREAIVRAEELLSSARLFGWVEGEAMASWTLAEAHADLGQPEIAADEFEATYRRLRDAGNAPWAAMALSQLATSEIAAGDVASATRHREQAFAEGRQRVPSFERAEILSAGTGWLLAAGRIAEAARLVEEAMSATVDSPAALWLAAARVKLAQGDPAQALAFARNVYLKSADSDWQAPTLSGRALHRLGRTSEAEDELHRAIALIEEHRSSVTADAPSRASYLHDKLEPYRNLVDLLAEAGRASEALATAERMRARALRDLLAEGRVEIAADTRIEGLAASTEWEERLVNVNRTILTEPVGDSRRKLELEREAIRQEIQRRRTELEIAHPSRTGEGTSERLDLLVEEGAFIPPDGVAVELVVADDHTWAFLVSHEAGGRPAVKVRRIAAGGTTLSPLVARLTKEIESRDPGFTLTARHLYEELIAPIEDDIAEAKAICLVPDGVLWRLPFDALKDRTGRDLVDRFSVFRRPSLASLRPERPSREAKPHLLALADPAVAGATAS
ncbi:MAG TPA: CHAT domain-containing protein, partial [Thermoanaerobaculia bacterium]|nr:CHAT domain-containing protein [Thermoanaerobaculia bacterium]